MEFRKMVMITQYIKQKKRHRCTEQNFGLCGEGEGGMFWENSIETCILPMVKQITSPGWMHETSAKTWCTGKTQRDWVEGEEGGGIRMGILVTPWLIHVNVWQNTLQYGNVIILQLIKINDEKKDVKKNKRSFFLNFWLILSSLNVKLFLFSLFNMRLQFQSEHLLIL